MNLQQNAAIKMRQQNSQENKSPGEGNSAPNGSGNSERFLFDSFFHILGICMIMNIFFFCLLLLNLFIYLCVDWFIHREFQRVHDSMHSAISMNKTEVLDDVLNNFSEVILS